MPLFSRLAIDADAYSWSNAAYVLNEVRRPVRTLKIAGPLGLGICGVLYLLANVAYFSAATPKEVSNSGVTVAAYFFGRVFGRAAERALSVFVALSALGNVMTVTFAQARVNQELAKEGVIPFARFWASGWPFGAPSAGLLLHFIPSFIVIVAIPSGKSRAIKHKYYPRALLTLHRRCLQLHPRRRRLPLRRHQLLRHYRALYPPLAGSTNPQTIQSLVTCPALLPDRPRLLACGAIFETAGRERRYEFTLLAVSDRRNCGAARWGGVLVWMEGHPPVGGRLRVEGTKDGAEGWDRGDAVCAGEEA